MKEYDLILVVGYFRTAMSFLSVIRALGGKLRVAVLSADAGPALRAKTGTANAVFLELCCKFGADLLEVGESARATLMVVHQFPYDEALVQIIQRKVKVKGRAGLMTLAMAGIYKHDVFLRQFGIRKVYVPSRRFMCFLLERRQALMLYQDVEVEEVGLPFAQHRVFPEFAADWIIAAPTLFSFQSERGKQQYLKTINDLLDQIPADDVVVYKPHNGNAKDYFTPRLHYWIAGWLDQLPTFRKLFKLAGRLPWQWLCIQTDRIETSILHRSILRRAVHMAQMTPYADLSLEAFLPEIRNGVIGGLSNTIWGSLYFDLRYYNCVDESHRSERSHSPNKSSANLLDLNLRYFRTQFCKGDLSADVRNLGIITSEERSGDLVKSIMKDLENLN
jgi:hypothetical protein